MAGGSGWNSVIGLFPLVPKLRDGRPVQTAVPELRDCQRAFLSTLVGDPDGRFTHPRLWLQAKAIPSGQRDNLNGMLENGNRRVNRKRRVRKERDKRGKLLRKHLLAYWKFHVLKRSDELHSKEMESFEHS